MKERLKSLLKKPYFLALIGLVVFCLFVFARVKYTLVSQDSQTKKTGSLQKNVSSPQPQKKDKEKIPMYEQLLAQENQTSKSELAKDAENRVKKVKQVIVKEKKKENNNKTKVVTPVIEMPKQEILDPQEREKLTYVTNSDIREKVRYGAIFKGTQDIRQGSYVQIILEDEIALEDQKHPFKLRQGTILNALPTIVGERIHLQITSAKVGDELIDIRKYGLLCLEDPTLVEGIYHPQVAKMVTDATKKNARSKAWDLLPEEVSTLTEVGKEVLTISDLTETITVSGRLFVAFPKKEKQKKEKEKE